MCKRMKSQENLIKQQTEANKTFHRTTLNQQLFQNFLGGNKESTLLFVKQITQISS